MPTGIPRPRLRRNHFSVTARPISAPLGPARIYLAPSMPTAASSFVLTAVRESPQANAVISIACAAPPPLPSSPGAQPDHRAPSFPSEEEQCQAPSGHPDSCFELPEIPDVLELAARRSHCTNETSAHTRDIDDTDSREVERPAVLVCHRLVTRIELTRWCVFGSSPRRVPWPNSRGE